MGSDKCMLRVFSRVLPHHMMIVLYDMIMHDMMYGHLVDVVASASRTCHCLSTNVLCYRRNSVEFIDETVGKDNW